MNYSFVPMTLEERQNALNCIFAKANEDGTLPYTPDWDWEDYFNMVDIPAGKVKVDSSILAQGSVENKAPIKMSSTIITQQQFFDIMGYNPSENEHPQRPVTNVNYFELALFCNRCSMLAGKPCIMCFLEDDVFKPIVNLVDQGDIHLLTHYKSKFIPPDANGDSRVRGFRPPTIEEFKFAAFGAGDSIEHFVQNAHDFSCRQDFSVAQLLPNSFGIYDIGTELWLWTSSIFED